MKHTYEFYENFLLKSEIEYLKSKLNHIQWQVTDTKSTWVSGGFKAVINPHPSWVLPLLEHMKSTFDIDFNYIQYSKYSSLNHSSPPSQNNGFYLGQNPKTPLLGIGEKINLKLIRKHTKLEENIKFKNNDLLIVNSNLQHEISTVIPKGNLLIEPHYSLSFLKVIHQAGDTVYSELHT